LKGDCEKTVDYRLITWPEVNGVSLGFEGPGHAPDANAECMVKRVSFGLDEPQNPKERCIANFEDGSVWYETFMKTAVMTGKLKLTRVGATLNGYC
jgi:hypothetical protein